MNYLTVRQNVSWVIAVPFLNDYLFELVHFAATGAAGTMGLLGSNGPLAMLVSTLLPGLGLGLLKGMFIAEILQKSNKKIKGYGHHHDEGYDHKKQKRREFYPPPQFQQYRDDQFLDPFSYSTQY